MQKNDDIKQIIELQSVMNAKLDKFQEDLNEVKENLAEVKETQEERVLPAVTYIETNIKAYKDAYQVNNANAKKLEKRVEVLEDQAGITPPEELTLASVQ